MAYLSPEEIKKIGFDKVGEHVYISDKVSIYNPSKIALGSYIRIDDFCVLSAGKGGIEIGDFVHIASGAHLIGQGKITLKEFSGVSIKTTILSSNFNSRQDTIGSLGMFEEISNEHSDLLSVIAKPVLLEAFSSVGAHSIVMPGVTIGKGTLAGALSMVVEDLKPMKVYMGSPVRYVRKRDPKTFEEAEKRYKAFFEGKEKEIRKSYDPG